MLPPGKYTMTVSAEGYLTKELTFALKDKQVLEQPFGLEKKAPPAAPATLPATDKPVKDQPAGLEKPTGPGPLMLPVIKSNP